MAVHNSANSVTAMQFSPDGRRLAIGYLDGVRSWNTETRATGSATAAPLNRSDTVTGVAISPDGRLAAPAAQDGTMLLSPAIADASQLCDKLSGKMSHKHWREWVSPGIDYITTCPELPIAPTEPMWADR